jgi:hypothetical protein
MKLTIDTVITFELDSFSSFSHYSIIAFTH